MVPPIEYDEFGFIVDETIPDEEGTPAEQDEPATPVVPIRTDFPPEGSDYLGGHSDGWEYRTVFAGGRLAGSYEMSYSF